MCNDDEHGEEGLLGRVVYSLYIASQDLRYTLAKAHYARENKHPLDQRYSLYQTQTANLPKTSFGSSVNYL